MAHTPEEKESLARATALILISYGAARIERSKHVPNLAEFCFDGLRYIIPNDWKLAPILLRIGEQKIMDTIIKHRTGG